MKDKRDMSIYAQEFDEYIDDFVSICEEIGAPIVKEGLLTPEYVEQMDKLPSKWLKEYYDIDSEEQFDNLIVDSGIHTDPNGKTIVNNYFPEHESGAGNKLVQKNSRMQVDRHQFLWLKNKGERCPITVYTERLKIYREVESPLIMDDRTEEGMKKHLIANLYKWGPKSYYSYETWINNLEAYERTPIIDTKLYGRERWLRAFAYAVKMRQHRQGIIALVESGKHLEPWSVDRTLVKSRQSNSQPAYSFPTQGNGKSDDDVKENVRLAELVMKDPHAIGKTYYQSLERGQEKGNLFREFLEDLYPDRDWSLEIPTPQEILEAIQLQQDSYGLGDVIYYTRHQPTVAPVCKVITLPNSENEREALVANGMSEEILSKRAGSDEWNKNYQILVPDVWLKSKVRNVFAGSGPTNFVMQRYVYAVSEYVKEYNKDLTPMELASLSKEEEILIMLTKLVADVTGQPDAYGDYADYDSALQATMQWLSGDDKSGFDHAQNVLISNAFCVNFLLPLFKEEHHKVLRYLSYLFTFASIITPNGIYKFSMIIPSGHGRTNENGSHSSAVHAFLVDILANKYDPAEWYEQKKDLPVLGAWMGDDTFTVASSSQKDELVAIYQTAGMVAHPEKSLVSRWGGEYLKKNLLAWIRRRFKYLDFDDDKKVKEIDIFVATYDLMKSCVGTHFPEKSFPISDALQSIAVISRLGNVVHMPGLEPWVQYEIEIDELGLGTVSTEYLPLDNKSKWITEDGAKPDRKSFYTVKIDNPHDLVQIASREADWKGKSLEQIVGKTWRDAKTESEWEESFLSQEQVKCLTAIQNSDVAFWVAREDSFQYLDPDSYRNVRAGVSDTPEEEQQSVNEEDWDE